MNTRSCGEVERVGRFQIDGGAERAFFDVAPKALLRTASCEKISVGKHVEVEAAAVVAGAVDVAGAGLCSGFHAVDSDSGEQGPEASHRDIAAFAAIASGQRHARDALHGFSEIAVRKFADVLRGDDIDRLLSRRAFQPNALCSASRGSQ